MSFRSFGGLALAVALALSGLSPARAQVATIVSGVVTADGIPVAGATVSLRGDSLTLRTSSDARGAFAFPATPLGEYVISASKGDRVVSQPVEVSSGGARAILALEPLSVIGTVRATGALPPALRGATDAIFGNAALTRAPYARSLPNMLLQVPAAARGSNGQVHLNGEHADIAYVVDGIAVPQELSRALGAEIDPTNVSFAEVIGGAFPAQYGAKFGAVVDIATRSGSGPPALSFEGAGGSFGSTESEFVYHAPVGSGSFLVSSRLQRDGRALDPPVTDPVHDAGSTSVQFLRYSVPMHGSDSLNVDLNRSLQTFQIPPDTAKGQRAGQDDDETQSDLFASLQWRRAIGTRGFISVAPSYKRSRIRDFNDPVADLAPAAGNDCAAKPGDCVFSAAADRTSVSTGIAADVGTFGDLHAVRAGIAYRIDAIAKRYEITLQGDNFLGPVPIDIVDDAPNLARERSAYVQDTWKMGALWQLEYGVRADSFGLTSTDFSVGYAQVSPRVKVTRIFSSRSSIYGYYGRLFVPFGFENIGLASVPFLDPVSGTAFDLKPQRDSLYEAGARFAVGAWDAGLRIAHDVRTDVLDDGQVGSTNLHQDVNFANGRFDAQSLQISRTWESGAHAYATLTHSLTVDGGCGSSFLVDCGAIPDGLVPADHDQRLSGAAGLYLPARDGWYSFAAEYGSGLSNAQECDLCKVPPHLTIDADWGRAIGKGLALEVTVRNLFDDRYAVTLNSALQGTHFARPRSVELRLKAGP